MFSIAYGRNIFFIHSHTESVFFFFFVALTKLFPIQNTVHILIYDFKNQMQDEWIKNGKLTTVGSGL